MRENLAGMRAMRKDQIGFLQQALREHGDIFRMRLAGLPMVMVNRPEYIHHVLVDHHERYDKNGFLDRTTRAILRDGLIGNPGGEPWRTRRRIMAPAFTRGSVATFAEGMTDLTTGLMDRWRSTVGPDEVVDVSEAVSKLTLRIVLSSLCGFDPGERTERFERDFLEVNDLAGQYVRFPFPPLNWRTPSRNRLRAGIARLDEFVSYLIRTRLDEPTERLDLFAMLAGALDPDSGAGLSLDQLANEVLTMIIAGYETSANAMAWICYELATHPDVQRRVQEEVDRVLDGRVPTFADLSELTYTRMVIDETLRLRTPAWHTMRNSVDEDVIGGYRIPKGVSIYLNMLLFHRHREFWPDPTRFDPDRFTPEEVARRPRNVYQPFGSGPRHCIGKHFALIEFHLITAMLAQAFTVSRPAGQPDVGFAPLLTLHPKGGIHLRLQRR
ncbi:cytochrome P450 [Kitasatospora sp. NPDC058965]|uniref:cytochrome P450 n=1 Tax=Kitasatospora sp. NPDC058965 TaxID=3346682 RepID=UPI003688AC2E